MKIRSAYGVFAAFAAATALMLWAVIPRERDGAADRAATSSAQTASGPDVAAPAKSAAGGRTRRAPATSGREYGLRYAFALELPTTPGSPPAKAELALEASISHQPLPSAAGGAWLGVRVTDARVTANEVALGLIGLSPKERGEAFDLTFAVERGPDGRVSQVRFPSGTPDGVRTTLASVIYATQWSVGEGDATTWTVDETSLNGRRRFHYNRAGDQLTKKFAQRPGVDTPGPVLAEVIGTFSLADAELVDATVVETGASNVSQLGEAAKVEYRVETTLSSGRESGGEWARGLDPKDLVAFVPSEVKVAREDAPIQPRPWSVLLQAVADEKAPAEGGRDSVAHDALRDEVVAALEADPTLPARVAKELRGGASEDQKQVTLVEALVSARTPEAHREVVALIDDQAVDRSLQNLLFNGLTLVPKADRVVVDALARVAFKGQRSDMAANAAVAIGGLLSRMDEKDADYASELSQALVDTARPVIESGLAPDSSGGVTPPQNPPRVVGTLNERIAWLQALGNDPNPNGLGILLDALARDPEAPARAAAVRALRFHEPAACVPALEVAYAKEQSIVVREAIMQVARFLGPAHMQALVEKSLNYDPSEWVRRTAALTVAVWSTSTPALDKILRDALERDQPQKVRESILNYLESGRNAQVIGSEGQVP